MLLYEGGVLDKLRMAWKRPRILEIGGGFGAIASAVSDMVGAQEYVICDLPESLMFSGLYLKLTKPEASVSVIGDRYEQNTGFRLLSNYKFDLLKGQHFDLVINTLSMSEMSPRQVDVYARGISSMIDETGVFFDQNADNRHMNLIYAKDHIAPHFAKRNDLLSAIAPHMQGDPTLWSN